MLPILQLCFFLTDCYSYLWVAGVALARRLDVRNAAHTAPAEDPLREHRAHFRQLDSSWERAALASRL